MVFGIVYDMKSNNIFIQSNSFDISTDDVLSWIYYLLPNAKIVTLYDNLIINKVEIFLSNNRSYINLIEI